MVILSHREKKTLIKILFLDLKRVVWLSAWVFQNTYLKRLFIQASYSSWFGIFQWDIVKPNPEKKEIYLPPPKKDTITLNKVTVKI